MGIHFPSNFNEKYSSRSSKINRLPKAIKQAIGSKLLLHEQDKD